MNLANKIFTNVFNTTEKNKSVKMHQPPKKDKGKDKDFYEWKTLKKDVTHEADILYMASDDETNEKYILVITDVATRLTDGRGLKTLESEEILKKIKEIYSSNILKKPTFSIHLDQGFNNKTIKDYFKPTTYIQITKRGRHRQNAMAENRNYLLARVLQMRMNSAELYHNEEENNWSEYLHEVIKKMNEYLKRTPNYDVEKEFNKKNPFQPTFNKKLHDQIILLPIGTKIRVMLDEPRKVINNQKEKLIGNFRSGDLRWEDNIRTIEDYLIKPNHPILYKISKIKNTYYTRNQLQLYNENDEIIPEKTIKRFVIEKLIKRIKKNNKYYFTVKFKGYEKTEDILESILIKDVPEMVKKFKK
jgi:hypothetical protein